ncbi:hypothetical protein P9314_16770, partial [Paenibacillus validus]|nr:hypothetical protein [Paenibacillus validus]
MIDRPGRFPFHPDRVDIKEIIAMKLDPNTETPAGSGSGEPDKHLRVLVMTAVAAERDAVLRGLRGSGRFDVLLAGVGPAIA